MKKPKKNAGKMPSFQFYPADWRKDPAVQALDYEARGIWHEMLCLMHESEQRGVLLLNGQPMPEDALARLLGLDNQKLTDVLTKLVKYGVARIREEDGAIYNKRMVADEKLCEIRRNIGKLGGNPLLVNQNPTTPVNQKSTPSSSSSSSTSVSLLSLCDEVAMKGWNPSEQQIEVASWFSRRSTTEWSAKELKAWKTVQPINAEDFEAVKWFYTESGCPYLRKDLQTLLNNWNGEVDRAKNYDPERDKRR